LGDGGQLGTGGAELVTGGGTDCHELGIRDAQLGNADELGTNNPQLDHDPELGTTDAQLGGGEELSSQVLQRSVDLDDADDDFELQSPPKARGRPKEKPKAAKAKRNLGIALVREDIEMHEKQLNLLPVEQIMAGSPTFHSSHEVFLEFKPFVFQKKPKPPTAYQIGKLPTGKPILTLSEISRMLPKDLIDKCAAKVSAYQKKHPGVQEMDIALDIVGIGVFPNSVVALMKKWHRAVRELREIRTALGWIAQIDFTRNGNPSFFVEEDPALPGKLKDIPILTAQVLSRFGCVFQFPNLLLHLIFHRQKCSIGPQGN
jgi:hypothetical protein